MDISLARRDEYWKALNSDTMSSSSGRRVKITLTFKSIELVKPSLIRLLKTYLFVP